MPIVYAILALIIAINAAVIAMMLNAYLATIAQHDLAESLEER